MSKRGSGSAPNSPSKKRPKVTPGQPSLLRYFGTQSSPSPSSPWKGRVSVSPAAPSGNTNKQPSDDHARGTNSAGLDDELYAWKLAERDGLDANTLKKLEEDASASKKREETAGKAGPSTAISTNSVEIIDVDSFENETNIRAPAASPRLPQRTRSSSELPRDIEAHAGPSSGPSEAPVPFSLAGSVTASIPETSYGSLSVDPASFAVPDIWPVTTPVAYSFLAHTLATVSGTRSRIAISNTLTNSLRIITKQHPPSLLPALYLLSNSLSPPYSPIELGLGPSIITKAIQHVSGLTPVALRRLYNKTGDPGDVAFEAKSNVRTLVPHPPLLITGVYESLLKIAHTKGQGATSQKQRIVEKLLVAARGEETRFLVRTLCQNLRVGAVRNSLLTALSRAMALTPPHSLISSIPPDSPYYVTPELLAQVKPLAPDTKKKAANPARDSINSIFASAEALLKRIYVQHPNYDHIVQALLEVGLDGLRDRLPLTVGVPLLPTLGSPTRSLDEIYDRLGLLPFSAEFKYDGQRAQIHASRRDGTNISVQIFSRHLEDMTDKYPDVVSLIHDMYQASSQMESFIIDSEIVAINPSDGGIKSFQELSNRARKGVKLDDVKVTVCVFAFDVMYLNGQVLLERPFRERRMLLRSNISPFTSDRKDAARFSHVQSCESEGGREALEAFWQVALNSPCEGLMIKLLDSGDILEEVSQKEKTRRKPLPATYEPDKRTSAWLKLKKDYVTGLGDSLDLVPIGAWHGNGRKAQWWSPILLAVWDPDAGKLVAVCKCMSGFTDVFYKSLSERYPENSDTCSPEPLWEPECETGGLRPEVFFKPQEVWEIRGADVTVSPVSVAALGLVNPKRGLSVRFPRFMRIREDKGLEDASTPGFLADMYRRQQATGKDQAGADDGELVDVSEESSVEKSGDETL
ncbi:ATP-dependent DNA ligase [Laetiporus sulphureus 93-53]|uniref:DNA ligase n=1 Tax=Laetiporus sulphureus 93-53 TaxID=1314785 RepID=A0A165F3X0_9APHY|nr:ATP-dependent DNA ligase [Laetiporus sulphureus 93-53]KZT08332.1 ATP-dependent DNA ligase [Laetiporus sulphureus 93-53]